MSEEKKQGFYLDKVRSTIGEKKELVIQGYVVDGYMGTMRPRAAIFVGGRPVKALKCRTDVVKLPHQLMRRRNGENISYKEIIYIDMSDITRNMASGYGDNAKLVLIGEIKKEKRRDMIFKASLRKIFQIVNTFNFSVDVAYVENGKTCLRGWMGNSGSAVIKIEALKSLKEKNSDDSEDSSNNNNESVSAGVDGTERVRSKDAPEYLSYDITYSYRDDVLREYPECPSNARLGCMINIDGAYKKLRVTMQENGKKKTEIITVGSSSNEFSRSNVISRYSEKIVRNLKTYGLRETLTKVGMRLTPSHLSASRHYDKWLVEVSPSEGVLADQRIFEKKYEYRPLFSILVPLYETDEGFLKELIESVQAQTYSNWELCFSDGSHDPERLREIIGKYSEKDSRIRYVAELPGPLGISSNTNQAYSIAKGDFIVLGDHDDLFTADALYECVYVMNKKYVVEKEEDEEKKKEKNKDWVRPENTRYRKELNQMTRVEVTEDEDVIYGDLIDVIYTDEDKTNSTAKKRFEPNLKPDFNQQLLESCNYITHMFVARKSLVDEVGLFDDEYNGAQDYDFILRCTEKARLIYHIPRVVYSWRINDTSTAGNPAAKMYAYDAGRKALQAHYDRVGIKGTAEIGDHLGYYHTTFDIPENSRLYVAVIDASDEAEYFKTVKAIENKSDFKNISFVRISEVPDGSVSGSDKKNLGYAAQLNLAVAKIREEVNKSDNKDIGDTYVCFMEAGIEMMGADGLSNMLGYISCNKNAAAIGGKIFVSGGTIIHSGVILDMASIQGWMYMRHSKFDEMYFNYSSYSALRRGVTMMRLSDLERRGAFNEKYKGEYGLVEYTYDMTFDDMVNIYDANAEFKVIPPRGKDAEEIFEDVNQKMKEFSLFMSRHLEVYKKGDRYYSNTYRKAD